MSHFETLKEGLININTFTIKAKLPSLNDVIAKNRANKYYANSFKQDIEEVIGWAIKQARVMKTLKPVNKPCIIKMEWHEATKRRDVDNIQSSQKFVLDSMVKNGILQNDSRRYVKQVYHEIIDDSVDYVVVSIEEFI